MSTKYEPHPQAPFPILPSSHPPQDLQEPPSESGTRPCEQPKGKKQKVGVGKPKIVFDAAKVEIEAHFVVEMYERQTSQLKSEKVKAVHKAMDALIVREAEFSTASEEHFEESVQCLARIRQWADLLEDMISAMESFTTRSGMFSL